jgi:shikimate dehydrogenase
MKNKSKAACVLGRGIKYSRSPIIHGHWIEQYGLDATYGICDLEPAKVNHLMNEIRSGDKVGCNVTVPYKQEVIQYLDELDEPAKATGSVNTIYLRDGLLRGTSTDGIGYLSHLKNTHPDFAIDTSSILILGAGGAARSIAMAFIAHGCSAVFVTNRTRDKATGLSKLAPPKITPIAWEQRAEVAGQVDLVVNSTVLGMQGKAALHFNVESTSATCIISDIVYAPLETELLASAKRRGRRTLDGLGMLLHQAAPGFQLWFGLFPEVTDDLRQIVEKDLIENG